jgi:hypothetical protein
VLSYTTRESVSGTCYYLFILFISFLGQLGVSLGILLYTDYVSLIGFTNAQVVRYTMLSSAGLIFFVFLTGIFYYCMISKEYKKRQMYFRLYGQPPDDLEPVVGEDLWRKYERTMVRWNRIFD